MNDKELRELDVWIAENVLGWEWWKSSVSGNRCLFAPGSIPRCADEWFKERADKTEGLAADWPPHDLPRPTTNPADAMEVLKKCAEKWGRVINIRHTENRWVVGKDSSWEEAPTIELAICRFAKQLFGKEKE